MSKLLQLVPFAIKYKVRIALIGGVIVGLLLGLAIGWWWWPVQWTNATPGHLRSDFQSDYLAWVAEQYSQTGDLEWARARLGAEFWREGQLAETLENLAQQRGGEEAIRLRALARGLASVPAPVTQPTRSLLSRLRPLLLVCGVGLLVVLLGLGVVYLIARLRAPRAAAPGRAVGVPERYAAEPVSWGAVGPPVAQFPTTYTLGDDHYDPSFSIELENGEFMGECGVGISETIGVGSPSKVTAFEVWLFDKSDIRTVTKVLMSDYAYHDEALRAKLAPKGEPMLIEVGREAILETKTLRVRARIVEAEYGTGSLPPNSFFQRLTIDLAAWVKPGQEEPALPDLPL